MKDDRQDKIFKSTTNKNIFEITKLINEYDFTTKYTD